MCDAMRTENENLLMAEKIAAAVSAAGGRAFYVGGFVRDRVRGMPGKDIDLEIHAVPYEVLTGILSKLGQVKVMGASFGVFGLKGYDLDIAMPRREKATGRGHRDFAVYTDPFIGPEKAALRRDFTMNAMMQDVLTGEILDFFNGKEDLEKGTVRHVNGDTFAEDPLRVLRAAQFAARFGFTVAEETRDLCRDMALETLSKERIMGELEKALLKAERPSVFFRELREMNQLSCWFPEVERLIGVPQNPVYHPEGDVWNHTMATLDEAAALREAAAFPKAFMLAALCHDFGKILTTAEFDGVIHAYRHETEGIPLIEAFLQRLTNETELKRYVLNMAQLHMRPNMMVDQRSSEKAYMRLFDESLCPEDLLLLAKADHLSSGSSGDYAAKEAYLRERLGRYRILMEQPQVQGRDLLEAGMAPGPEMKEAIAFARKLHLAGVKKEEALTQTLGVFRKRRGL